VSRPDAGLSIVILTEGSGKDGRATIEALAKQMFHLVGPGFGSHRIQFVPRDQREEEAMRGNVWKTDGKNPQEYERRVRLLRYIARNLLLPNTLVLFHIDGDRPWSERHTSENTAKFERLVRGRLPQVVDRGRANNPTTKAQARENTSLPPQLHLENLLLICICPFRSIEAWLYQNLRTAVAICSREHWGIHVTDLEAWEQRRGELDELPAPEKSSCLRKEFNLELATHGFPTRETYEVRKSFAESVDRMLACSTLCRALELTRD
jgi:hypothetical protein